MRITVPASLCILPAIVLLLAGCISDELPIAPYDRGSVERATVAMGSDYRYQIYFDLEAGSELQRVRITDWDLGFESSDTGYHIILNSSKAMAVYDVGPVEFNSVTSRSGAVWRYDAPDGNLDSTAIGIWWEKEGATIASRHHTYIIDRGYDETGKQQGYIKMQVESFNAETYIIHTAALNGTQEQHITVGRNTALNFTAVSLSTGQVVDIEPSPAKWDILFTRYTHLFYTPALTPYSVTGVLLNPYGTTVAVDSAKEFSAISFADAEWYKFTNARDGIGYAWKSYDLNTGAYTVYPNYTYIIRTSTGFYYKLHFVDFYDDAGEKGAPTFEFQKL